MIQINNYIKMISFNDYILEKLHINKDTKINESLYNILINMCPSCFNDKVDEAIKKLLDELDIQSPDQAKLLTIYSTDHPSIKKLLNTKLLEKYFKNNFSAFPSPFDSFSEYVYSRVDIRKCVNPDKKNIIGFSITYTIGDPSSKIKDYPIYIFKK